MVSGDGITVLNYSVYIDVVVGTEQQQLTGVSIYPNPVRDQLIIELPSNLEAGNLQLFSVLGQRLFTEPLSGPRSSVSLRSLPEGMYILRIEADGRYLTQRILKQ